MSELTTFDKWWFDYCVKNGHRHPKKMREAAAHAWHAAAVQGVSVHVGAALLAAHAHTAELREAWQRGVIDERDGQSPKRSNRNIEVEVALRQVVEVLFPLRKLDD